MNAIQTRRIFSNLFSYCTKSALSLMNAMKLFLLCATIAPSVCANPYADLMSAIRRNKEQEIKRLLPLLDPSDLDARHKRYGCDTLLTEALKRNQFDTAQLLIQAGANVNTPNVRGLTPLSIVVSKVTSTDLNPKQLFLISSLVKAGANVNQQKIEEETLEWGPKKSTYAADRTTPIMNAIRNIPLCCWLIKQGADTSIKNKDGLDAAAYANRHYSVASLNKIDIEKLVKILSNPQAPDNIKFIDNGAAYIDKIMKDAHTKSKYQYVRNREFGQRTSKTRRAIEHDESAKYSLI